MVSCVGPGWRVENTTDGAGRGREGGEEGREGGVGGGGGGGGGRKEGGGGGGGGVNFWYTHGRAYVSSSSF